MAGRPEPDIPEVQARAACLDVFGSFFRLVDDGRAADTASLMTGDVEFTINGRSLRGDEVRAMMAARAADTSRRTAHVATPLMFRLTSAQEAGLTSHLQHYVLGDDRPHAAPDTLALIDDVFRRNEAGAWQLARRTLTRIAGV
jgi:hypothetical protein